MRSMLLINTKAGLLKGLTTPSEITQHLPGLRLNPKVTIARSNATIARFVTQAKQLQPDIILVAGGDGTVARVFKDLYRLKATFGILPTGSLNNVATSLGLPDDLPGCVEVINRGRTARMDAGQAGRRIFFESVGVGLLAEVMRRVGEQDSKKEVLRVVRHTIAEMLSCEPFTVRLTVDGETSQLETLWLTVTNNGRAGAVEVDPTARPDDRSLTVTYTNLINKTQLPATAISFLRGQHIRQRHFKRLRGQDIRIEIEQPRHIHVDGELIKQQQLNLRILPAALKIFIP